MSISTLRMAGGGFKFLLLTFQYLVGWGIFNWVISMNLWRKAPWRGTANVRRHFVLCILRRSCGFAKNYQRRSPLGGNSKKEIHYE
jgi:hypothetical protein